VRVLLLAVITLDGKIARNAHEFSGWSSREDKRLFARASREAGVVVMGRSTYETMPRPLPGRLNVVMTRQPPAIAPEGVEFTSDPPERIVERLAMRSYSAIVVAGGAQVYRAFLEAGVVDELWLTVEPLTFGAGVSLLGDVSLELRFTLLEAQRMGENTVHLRYAAAKSPQSIEEQP
jgi:dihydrofolate reductase